MARPGIASILGLLSALALAAGPALADARVWGYGRVERIAGRPEAGYKYLYETNVYLTPDGDGAAGESRRIGASPQTEPASPDADAQSGYFSFTVPAGRYALLLDQPDFFVRPVVVSDISVGDGEEVFVPVELPVEYATYVEDLDWTDSEGDVWYQTFVAVGSSVTGASFRIANRQDQAIEVSVLKSDGGQSPQSWPVVGSAMVENPGTLSDNWVRWRSGEITLEPGQLYAVRLSGGALQPLKRDKDALSYAGGTAFNKAGAAKEFDLDLLLFGDSDGTCVTVSQRHPDKAGRAGGQEDFADRWGMTFVARGTSLAAADLFASGSVGEGWRQGFTWRVRDGGPGGALVAAARTNVGAWFGPGTGLYGIAWSRDDVPLVPDQTYYLEVEGRANPTDLASSAGFTPYFMRLDSVDDSRSFKDGVEQPEDVDLNLTVVQYTDNTCTEPLAQPCSGAECPDAGAGGATDQDAALSDGDDHAGFAQGGCGCRAAGRDAPSAALLALMLLMLARRRRRCG